MIPQRQIPWKKRLQDLVTYVEFTTHKTLESVLDTVDGIDILKKMPRKGSGRMYILRVCKYYGFSAKQLELLFQSLIPESTAPSAVPGVSPGQE